MINILFGIHQIRESIKCTLDRIPNYLAQRGYTHHILHDGRHGRTHHGDRRVLCHDRRDLKHDCYN